MIPSPAEDIGLLREHLYLENIFTNLIYVLNPLKFSELGGFKSTKDFGLGYFNYDVKLGSSIYSSSFIIQLSYKVFSMFNIFFGVYLLLLTYCLLNIVKIDRLTAIEYLTNQFKALVKMDKKKYLYDKTEFLDDQEKGEYNRSSDGLHARKDASNNDLEYNHIKL